MSRFDECHVVLSEAFGHSMRLSFSLLFFPPPPPLPPPSPPPPPPPPFPPFSLFLLLLSLLLLRPFDVIFVPLTGVGLVELDFNGSVKTFNNFNQFILKMI